MTPYQRDARLRRLRPEGDLVVSVAVPEGASYARSIRTTGKMIMVADTFGTRAGASQNLRRTCGKVMTVPIAAPGRLEN